MNSDDFTIFICMNSDCLIILINRIFLLKHLSNVRIKKSEVSSAVCSIESQFYQISEFIQLNLYINNQQNENSAIVHFIRKTHIVKEFRINILLKIDALNNK